MDTLQELKNELFLEFKSKYNLDIYSKFSVTITKHGFKPNYSIKQNGNGYSMFKTTLLNTLCRHNRFELFYGRYTTGYIKYYINSQGITEFWCVNQLLNCCKENHNAII